MKVSIDTHYEVIEVTVFADGEQHASTIAVVRPVDALNMPRLVEWDGFEGTVWVEVSDGQ